MMDSVDPKAYFGVWTYVRYMYIRTNEPIDIYKSRPRT